MAGRAINPVPVVPENYLPEQMDKEIRSGTG